MNKNNQLPPIIEQYIDNLHNPKTSKFQRETYCMILERVRDASSAAIAKYKEQQQFSKVSRK